jgi:hypothetical protein
VIFIEKGTMNTTQEIDKLIQIEQQKLQLVNTLEQKNVIQIRIQRLQFQREIAVIRKKIEQLD